MSPQHISRTPRVTVDVHLTDTEWNQTLVADSAAGLASTPKRLSPVWFYDEHGSNLFDEITRLDEYYPTRAERALLDHHASEIAVEAKADTLVELGSGTSDKTRLLLDAMAAAESLVRYIPFDVSELTVRDAAESLVDEYPGLEIHAVIGDFHRHLDTIPREGRRLIAFLGGTIGNLAPAERRSFLHSLVATMSNDDRLLIGVDLVKDPDVLERAYDDASGVTAAFNRNALTHLNRRLDADFDPSAFEHVARWNATDNWIEMHLRSTTAQTVRIETLDLEISFERGEEMRTEISAKFTPDGLEAELAEAGLDTQAAWTEQPGFQLTLARLAER